MMMTTIRSILATCMLLLASACGTPPKIVTNTVNVPVPVPCNIQAPEKPYMPYTDVDKDKLPPDEAKDIYAWIKKMLAEIELRKGYEGELETAIQACNDKK